MKQIQKDGCMVALKINNILTEALDQQWGRSVKIVFLKDYLSSVQNHSPVAKIVKLEVNDHLT